MVYSVLYVKTPIFIGPPSRWLMILSGCLHLRLRLLQPVGHPHLAIHRRRVGEMRLRLLALAGAPVELAEAEVAVGDEGAHAARLGEGQGLAVMGLTPLRIESFGVDCDVAEELLGMRGEPRMMRRAFDRAVTKAPRLVETAEQETSATQ